MKTALKSMIAFSFLVLACSTAFACGGDKHMSSSGDGTTQGEGAGSGE